MRVTELNRDELDELKQSYAGERNNNISYGELADALDIPDDVIFDHFDGIEFTENDFFCNMYN